MTEHKFALGSIGGGNMAEAIIRAAINADVIRAERIFVADPTPERRAVFEQIGVATTTDNAALVAESACVLLAVKPQIFPAVTGDLAAVGADQLIVSIMAGVKLEKIVEASGEGARVIRVMPNTPLLANAGMSALASADGVSEADVAFALSLFTAAGEAEVVDESMMDAVTAVSGSGPAYLFYLAEAMTERAIALGFPETQAADFVSQTLFGAASLLKESDDSAAELRRKVTSPGGTTQAAIEYMEASEMRATIGDAVSAAAKRSEELGRT